MTPLSATKAQFNFRDPHFRRTIVSAGLVSVAYYITAKFGFEFALQPGSVSAIWMPNAIVLAGLMLTPRPWWWLLIAASLPAHLASEIQSGVPTMMVLSWFLSNSTQALIGAFLVHHFVGGEIRLGRSRDLATFLLCGALLAPFLASFLDSSLVKLNGWGNNSFWELWRLRFLSNVLATLILIPFIVEWAQRGIKTLKHVSMARYLEALVLFGSLLAIGYAVFNTQTPLVQTAALLYWPLPLLVWATIRFGLRGLSTALLVVNLLAISGAAQSIGPFIGSDASHSALSIQAFLIVVAVPLLLLAAVIEERQLAEATARDIARKLTETNARNQAILRAIPDTMFLHDSNGGFLDYYTRDPRLLSMSPGEFLGKTASEVLPPQLAERVHEAFKRVHDGDEPQVLEYSLPVNDEDRYFEARLVSAEGFRVLSIVRDVTEARLAAEAIRESESRLLQSTRKIRALAAQLITAQESERRRIAILLHDDVGQNIATLGLAISRLKRKPPNGNAGLAAELHNLAAQVDHLTTQVRQLSHDLHPEVLEHVGLIAALKAHMTELEAHKQLKIKFSAEVETDPIPRDVAVCLYRVALEAVRNVSMHSGADSADIVLKESDGCLVLQVSDSGHGFDIEKVRHGSGLGLASSEERVKLLSGTLEIRSNAPAGTCLTARVPLCGSS